MQLDEPGCTFTEKESSMLKKRWFRWSATAVALSVPAMAFAATQVAESGGCLFGLFSCPF